MIAPLGCKVNPATCVRIKMPRCDDGDLDRAELEQGQGLAIICWLGITEEVDKPTDAVIIILTRYAVIIDVCRIAPFRQTRALRQQGLLYPHPEAVTDPLFQQSRFFDPQDSVQVKYEMLRRVEVDKVSVTEAAGRFGFSRPSFYQAQIAFTEHGLVGLLPQKRGPRGGHKLTAEVMAFVMRERAVRPPPTTGELVAKIGREWGVTVHRRSLERQLAQQEKKRRAPSVAPPPPATP